MDRFADRLDPALYATEEPVGIGRASQHRDDWLYIPEPLFMRLLHLGAAYRLHVLETLLNPYVEVELNGTQCAGLLDELVFIAAAVNDPLLGSVLTELQDRVAACARSPDELLVIDWP
jgi:hypothetical protein